MENCVRPMLIAVTPPAPATQYFQLVSVSPLQARRSVVAQPFKAPNLLGRFVILDLKEPMIVVVERKLVTLLCSESSVALGKV